MTHPNEAKTTAGLFDLRHGSDAAEVARQLAAIETNDMQRDYLRQIARTLPQGERPVDHDDASVKRKLHLLDLLDDFIHDDDPTDLASAYDRATLRDWGSVPLLQLDWCIESGEWLAIDARDSTPTDLKVMGAETIRGLCEKIRAHLQHFPVTK